MSELELMKIFSKNLKRIMREEKINQTELAKEIGVNRTTISRYITGQCIPSFHTIVKIADILFCSLDDFIAE